MVFHISKLNNLKVIIHDLYPQCLTQALSKMTSFFSVEGVSHNGITANKCLHSHKSQQLTLDSIKESTALSNAE
jgi:hypothetical protein